MNFQSSPWNQRWLPSVNTSVGNAHHDDRHEAAERPAFAGVRAGRPAHGIAALYLAAPSPVRRVLRCRHERRRDRRAVHPAPPEAIFELIADPTRHRDIDGSGTVRDPKEAAAAAGARQPVRDVDEDGLPYSMVSTVVEYEPNRRLAWQTRGPAAVGRRVGGRIWRYELEPATAAPS